MDGSFNIYYCEDILYDGNFLAGWNFLLRKHIQTLKISSSAFYGLVMKLYKRS